MNKTDPYEKFADDMVNLGFVFVGVFALIALIAFIWSKL